VDVVDVLEALERQARSIAEHEAAGTLFAAIAAGDAGATAKAIAGMQNNINADAVAAQ
jgi:hypothetical protein